MNRFYNSQDPDWPDTSEMTPEQKRQYLVAIDAYRPVLPSGVSGTVVIVGTGGGFDNRDAAAIFYSRPLPDLKEEVGKLTGYFTPGIPSPE